MSDYLEEAFGMDAEERRTSSLEDEESGRRQTLVMSVLSAANKRYGERSCFMVYTQLLHQDWERLTPPSPPNTQMKVSELPFKNRFYPSSL